MGSKSIRSDDGSVGANNIHQLLHRFSSPSFINCEEASEPGNGSSDVMRRLIFEISETVLPRQLIVECAPVGSLRLQVSNRRLLGMQIETSEGIVQIQTPSNPEAAASLYIEEAKALFSSSQTLRFQKPIRTSHNADLSRSCSVDLLAAAAGFDFDIAENDGVKVDLFSDVKTFVHTWLQLDSNNKEQAHEGGEAELSLLRHVASRCVAEFGAGPKHLEFGATRDFYMTAKVRDDTALIMAHENGQFLLALVELVRLPNLMQRFSDTQK